MSFITRHLKEGNLNYVEHLCCAWFFAFLHLMVVPIALFHGIFPFLIPGLGKKLNSKIRPRYDSLATFFQTQNPKN
jgi:hypothetical protein